MRRAALGLVGSFLAAFALGNTYTVTTTADAGAGSLRQAITDANASPGADTIAFGIVGTGPHTITLASALPEITDAVTIDGYTQAGASPNTRPVGEGLDTVLQVVVTANATSTCFVSTASNVTIRGLVIHRCTTAPIVLTGAGTNNVVAGNFLGTMPDGATLPVNGNVSSGVHIAGQTGARVGGLVPADRNLLAGFNFGQVQISGGSGHVVQGNLIGMKASGAETLGSLGDSSRGFAATAGTGLVVGGASTAARNVFGNLFAAIELGNTAQGIVQGNFVGLDVTGQRVIIQGQALNDGGLAVSLYSSDAGTEILGNTLAGYYQGVSVSTGAPVIQGNFIGTDATGTLDLSVQQRGIHVQNATGAIIGGIGAGEGNLIVNSGRTAGPAAGVAVDNGTATIRGNSIHSTRSAIIFGDAPPTDVLGIDLAPSFNGGVTPNDPGDGDSGANGLQNFPLLIIGGARRPPGQRHARHRHAQQRRIHRRSTSISTGSATSARRTSSKGRSTSARSRSRRMARERRIRRGALDDDRRRDFRDGDRDRSWRQHLGILAADPDVELPALRSGGRRHRRDLQGNALRGRRDPHRGRRAGDERRRDERDDHHGEHAGLAGRIRQRRRRHEPERPGRNADQRLGRQLPGCPPGVSLSWLDPQARPKRHHRGHAAPATTVPTSPTLRQQMAVFLLKGSTGSATRRRPARGPSTTCPAVEQLRALDRGARGRRHHRRLRRRQLLPGEPCPAAADGGLSAEGQARLRLSAPGLHGRLPRRAVSNPFADWIEQLAAEGITGGCGAGNFCPGQAVTRGQMAAFLGITFRLPW